MNLVDMKLPKKSTKELKAEMMPQRMDERDQWPYGLKLNFEKEQVDKIKSLKAFNVGDKVTIQGEGLVVEVRISERQNGNENHSVEIQIEKVGVELVKKKKPEEMSMAEYRQMRTEK